MNKDHLFLKALRGEQVERPPVWLMRQAGRYLPEYMVLKKKYDFFTRIRTPELATEITLQPIDIIKPDAAILFSDILVIPEVMGLEVQMIPGKGPFLPETIKSQADVDKLQVEGTADALQYVYDALKMTKRELNDRVPLIGFAGAPFTIFCYMVEGQGSKTFHQAKTLCFSQPEVAKNLLDKITKVTIAYLLRKIENGADVIQVFDSWSGLLSYADFMEFSLPYLKKIHDALCDKVPVILFPKGSDYALTDIAKLNPAAIGLDWTITPEEARAKTSNITLQGNMDPSKLFMTGDKIKEEVTNMINRFGVQNYIVNLGHGMLPTIPVDSVKSFVDAVKSYEKL